MSTRVTSAAISVLLRRLDELGEHAAGRLWVYERDSAVPDAHARLLVDQPEPFRAGLIQRGVDVAGLVRHVVEARAGALDEAADGALRVGRAEQLHVRLPDPEQRGLHAELLDGLAVLERHPEPPL